MSPERDIVTRHTVARAALAHIHAGLRADMKRQGIHVGVDQPPVCACCDEPWPCPAERAARQV